MKLSSHPLLRYLCCLLIFTDVHAPAQTQNQTPPVPKGEPINAAEASRQNLWGNKISPEKYQAYQDIVKSLPPAQQKWEHQLEAQLGGFYFPIYVTQRIQPNWPGAAADWGYVENNPALPNVLIIGDSISRSYTSDTRKLLTGKANVYRAPANCGPTANGLKYLASWLDQGTGKWDLITFNFGIHDKDTNPERYAANLETIIGKLRATSAKLLWVNTTPFGENGDESEPVNKIANAIMAKENIPIADVHAAMLPHVADMQDSRHIHFNSAGTKLLAETMAQAIEPLLPAKQK